MLIFFLEYFNCVIILSLRIYLFSKDHWILNNSENQRKLVFNWRKGSNIFIASICSLGTGVFADCGIPVVDEVFECILQELTIFSLGLCYQNNFQYRLLCLPGFSSFFTRETFAKTRHLFISLTEYTEYAWFNCKIKVLTDRKLFKSPIYMLRNEVIIYLLVRFSLKGNTRLLTLHFDYFKSSA